MSIKRSKQIASIPVLLSVILFAGCGDEKKKTVKEKSSEGKEYRITLAGYEGVMVSPDEINIRDYTLKDSSGKVEKFPLIDIKNEYTLIIKRTSLPLDSIKAETVRSPFDKFKKFLYEGDNCFVAEASAFMDDVEMVYIMAVVIPGKETNYLIQPFAEMDDKQMAHVLMELAQGYKPNTK